LAQAARDFLTSDITTAPKNVAGEFGGVKRGTPSTVVSGYKFNAYVPSPFRQEKIITQYGLKLSSTIFNVSGAYNASIVMGQYITIEGLRCRLVGVRPVRGGSSTPTRLTMVAVAEA
jgi:hypothetical protein